MLFCAQILAISPQHSISCGGGGGGGGLQAKVRHCALQPYVLFFGIGIVHEPGHFCLATHSAHTVLFHGGVPIGHALRVSSIHCVSLPGGGGGGFNALHVTFQDPWLNVSIRPPTSTQPVVSASHQTQRLAAMATAQKTCEAVGQQEHALPGGTVIYEDVLFR